MNTTLQSGQAMQSAHLDADQLNAFAEGALPEHERTAALAHLAECASCREVAFLAQPADGQTAGALPHAQPVASPSGWRSWFAGSPLLGAAAAGLACTLLLAGVVHFRYLLAPDAAPSPTASAPAETAQVAEQIKPPLPSSVAPATPATASEAKVSPAPAPALKTPAPVAPLRSDAITPAPPRMAGAIGAAAPVVPAGASPTVVTKTPAAPKPQPELPISVAAAPFAARPALPSPPPQQQIPALTGNSRAEMARNAATAPSPTGTNTNAKDSANNSTQFANTINIETINALPAYDQLETRTRQVQPSKALPSKLPMVSQAATGARTLAIDSQGSVFLSTDSGRHWRAVRAPWTGKAAQVAIAPATRQFAAQLPPPPTAAAAPLAQNQDIATMGAAVSQTASPESQVQLNTFRLTTTTHEIWVSADGVTWRRGP